MSDRIDFTSAIMTGLWKELDTDLSQSLCSTTTSRHNDLQQLCVQLKELPPRCLYVECGDVKPDELYQLNPEYGNVLFGAPLEKQTWEMQDLIRQGYEILYLTDQGEVRPEKLLRYWPVFKTSEPPPYLSSPMMLPAFDSRRTHR